MSPPVPKVSLNPLNEALIIYYNIIVYLQSNCSQTSWSSGKKHRAPQPPSQTPENTNQESQFRNLKDKSLKKWKNDDSLRKKCYLTTGLSLLLLSIAILFVILLKRFVLGSDQNQISKYFLLSLSFFHIFFNKSYASSICSDKIFLSQARKFIFAWEKVTK